MPADLEMRMTLIETQFEKLHTKIDRISTEISDMRNDLQKDTSNVRSDIAFLRGKVDDMPSAEAFGVLRGRVESLPTTSKLASLLAIAVAVATIINTWPSILATLFIAHR